MRYYVSILALTITASTLAQQSIEAEQQWSDLVVELRSLERVGSAWVGPVPQPGPFFKLAERMIAVGHEADFRRLLENEQPHARCMGLLTLAQTAGKKAVPTLKAYLSDRGKIAYNPSGCGIYAATVADVSRDLLHNVNYLGFEKRPSCFLSKDQLVGVDLELVAKMPAIVQSERSTQYLMLTIESYETIPDLSWLQRQCPDLESFNVVRVLGALRPTRAKQDFLIDCLDDRELDPWSRLAAASALTRYGNDASTQAIEKYRQAFNNLNDQAWGDHITQTMKLRQEYEARMKFVRPMWPWRSVNPTYYDDAMASADYHPLVLDELFPMLTPRVARHDPALYRVGAGAAVKLAQRASECNQPWDTYSDTTAKLALLAERNRPVDAYRVLTQDECEEPDRSIQTDIEEQ